MKIADKIDFCCDDVHFDFFSEGDNSLAMRVGNETVLEYGRARIDGFDEAGGIAGKMRQHRTEDNFFAEIDSENSVPFGCEFTVRRHWKVFGGIAEETADISADNGGKVRALELETLHVPQTPVKVEFLVFGDDKLRCVTTPSGELYDGREALILLRWEMASGARGEFYAGDDFWRHRAGLTMAQGQAPCGNRLFCDQHGLTLERKIFQLPQDAEPEKRPWRFKTLLAVRGKKEDFSDSSALEISAPGCLAAAAVRRAVTSALRRSEAGKTAVVRGNFPHICTDGAHLDRKGRILEHGDLGEAAEIYLAGNRETAKRGGKVVLESGSSLFGQSVILEQLKCPLKRLEQSENKEA